MYCILRIHTMVVGHGFIDHAHPMSYLHNSSTVTAHEEELQLLMSYVGMTWDEHNLSTTIKMN